MRDRQTGEFAEIRSVGRALDLLEIMRRAAPAGIRVSDAAATLGIDPATASRLMSTLITRGYASRMPSRRYTLGARSLQLASGWIDRLLQVAAAPMRRIADGCGETVYLMQLVGTEAVTLARLTGGRRAMIEGEIGPSYLGRRPRGVPCLAHFRLPKASRCCRQSRIRPSPREPRRHGSISVRRCRLAAAAASMPRKVRSTCS